jgi:TatD DNase family protein
MNIIDTHCHLDNIKYYDNLQEVISRAKDNGIYKFIIPGADPDDLKIAENICDRFDNIYFSVGVHPDYCNKYDEDILLKSSQNPKCVGVGECGLDYYRLPENKTDKENTISMQKNILIKHIELSKKINKPLIIHTRDSSIDTQIILEKYCDPNIGGVIHCFDGSENLIPLRKLGFYFGIGGVVTFKNAKKLQNSMLNLELSNIVLETDSPYLTPHPYRGKINEPCHTALIRDKLSEIYKTDIKEISDITTKNASKLFSI